MIWIFRQVTLSDSQKILKWRNDPEIYRHLFNPAPIAAEDHEAWLARVILDPTVLFLIGTFDGRDVGTIRFDFAEKFSVAEVGIYLAPECHGQGLSTGMLSEAEKVAKEKMPSLKRIVAKVLIGNIASEKMFVRTGYDKKFVQLEKKLEN